jgi:hypothetical protein
VQVYILMAWRTLYALQAAAEQAPMSLVMTPQLKLAPALAMTQQQACSSAREPLLMLLCICLCTSILSPGFDVWVYARARVYACKHARVETRARAHARMQVRTHRDEHTKIMVSAGAVATLRVADSDYETVKIETSKRASPEQLDQST